jgi:hypothetical protein
VSLKVDFEYLICFAKRIWLCQVKVQQQSVDFGRCFLLGLFFLKFVVDVLEVVVFVQDHFFELRVFLLDAV